MGVLGALVLAGTALGVTATRVGAAQELVVVEHQTNIEFVIDGKASVTPPQAPPGPGSSIILRNNLLQGSTVIGYDNVICTVTFNNNVLCDAVLAINGKGDIHGTALIRGNPDGSSASVFDATIDGGTFAYRNARGDVHIITLPNGDTQLNINLV
jgi:hypothetical protein